MSSAGDYSWKDYSVEFVEDDPHSMGCIFRINSGGEGFLLFNLVNDGDIYWRRLVNLMGIDP